jgi:hypothetical protein
MIKTLSFYYNTPVCDTSEEEYFGDLKEENMVVSVLINTIKTMTLKKI